MALKGLNKVLKNLNKEIEGVKNKSLKGLISSAILVRRDMEKKFPVIPVDFGNLRASWFIVTSRGKKVSGFSPNFTGEKSGVMISNHTETISDTELLVKGKQPAVGMGFSANYAWYVHENVGQNFQKPGSGAKFFQGSLNRNKKEILNTIVKEAKIK